MSYGRLDDASAQFHLALEQPRMQQDGEVKFLAHDFLAQIAARRHDWSSVRTLMNQAANDRVRAYEYNLDVTRRVTEMAHAVGVSVEGELGCLGSLEHGGDAGEDSHGGTAGLSRDQLLTDPDQAAEFVAATGVDALAVAIGTSHGAYKFTRQPTGDILAMDVVKAIHARLPGTHLIMHGSSSVPQELQNVFNAHGGQMPQTWGVPVAEIQEGIRHGVRKINIDTDCRIAMTGQIRKVAAQKRGEFDLRNFLKPAMAALEELCAQRFEEFGAAGQAGRIRPLPLPEMAKRYRSGALAPHVTHHAKAA